jgi:hypothetical protein
MIIYNNARIINNKHTIKNEIGEIYSLLTFGYQITTHRNFYFYIHSPFCDQSQCHT